MSKGSFSFFSFIVFKDHIHNCVVQVMLRPKDQGPHGKSIEGHIVPGIEVRVSHIVDMCPTNQTPENAFLF